MEQKENSTNFLESKLSSLYSIKNATKAPDTNSKFTYSTDEKLEQTFSSLFTAGKEYRFFETQISFNLSDPSILNNDREIPENLSKENDLSIEKCIEEIYNQPKELPETKNLKKDEEKIEISLINEDQLLDLSLKTEIRIYSKETIFL